MMGIDNLTAHQTVKGSGKCRAYGMEVNYVGVHPPNLWQTTEGMDKSLHPGTSGGRYRNNLYPAILIGTVLLCVAFATKNDDFGPSRH